MGWFDELEKEIKKAEEEDKKKKAEREEVKEAEIVENKADKVKEEVKETPKKEEKPKKTAAKKETKKATKSEKKTEAQKKYKYPFSLYTEGRTVDISSYGFEDNKEYTDKEICDIMLRHRHYEFAGEMTFTIFEDDNTLVATAKQYKKG